MKEKFILTKNSFNAFLGLDEDQMGQLRGGLAYVPDVPYYPTGGGGGGGGGDELEEKPHKLQPARCQEGYVWDNVLNRCVRAR